MSVVEKKAQVLKLDPAVDLVFKGEPNDRTNIEKCALIKNNHWGCTA